MQVWSFNTEDEISHLPTLSAGMPTGQVALAMETGALYVLCFGSDAVDGTTVLAVNDDPNTRWFRVSSF